MRRLTLMLSLLALLSTPAWSETAYCATGVAGQTLTDFTRTGWDLSDGSALDLSSLAVSELGTEGEYRFTGLPDPTATTDLFAFRAEPDSGDTCIYLYPSAPPRATQAVEFRPGFRFLEGRTLAVGDAGVDIALEVTGLSGNPAGSTVEFDLWCRGTQVVTDGSACVGGDVGCGSDADPVEASDGTWAATLFYDTTIADLSTAADGCVGKFTLDPGTASQITLPPTSTLTIDILEPAP